MGFLRVHYQPPFMTLATRIHTYHICTRFLAFFVSPHAATKIMNHSHLLFYSNRCTHSRQFLQQLQTLPNLATSVHQVCIDTTPRERIPSTVRSVPTLIVAGNLNPLVGDTAFQWLHTERQRAQQQAAQQSQQQQAMGGGGGGGGGGVAAAGGGEPSAWQSTEMGASFSDTYSFLNGGDVNNIPKNFAFVQGDAANVKQPAALMQQSQQQPHPSQQYTQRPAHQQYAQSQPVQRPNMPSSGYGTVTPNATMAPMSAGGGGMGGGGMMSGGGQAADELSQKMEALQMARAADVPLNAGRV